MLPVRMLLPEFGQCGPRLPVARFVSQEHLEPPDRLVRVAERQYPSKHEFSPRRYVEFLSQAVFGDRRQFTKNLRDQVGRYNQTLAHWFDDVEWMQAKFDLQTNSELNVLEKRTRK